MAEIFYIGGVRLLESDCVFVIFICYYSSVVKYDLIGKLRLSSS